MPVHEEVFAPGTPCWADVAVDDVERAEAFYGALFGWSFEHLPEHAGGYGLASLDGHAVAGLGARAPEQAGAPAAWTTYLATADADDTAKRAVAAGGVVFTGPTDLVDVARLAVGADAAGAVYGIWQGKTHLGADLVNEPGALCWAEALSRDYPASLAFYTDVFGYRLREIGEGGYRYSVAMLEGEPDRPVGGIGAIPAAAGPDVPSHWMTYFAVADADAAAERITELSGAVLNPPYDTPFGRLAQVAGPEGETFSIMRLAPAPDGSHG